MLRGKGGGNKQRQRKQKRKPTRWSNCYPQALKWTDSGIWTQSQRSSPCASKQGLSCLLCRAGQHLLTPKLPATAYLSKERTTAVGDSITSTTHSRCVLAKGKHLAPGWWGCCWRLSILLMEPQLTYPRLCCQHQQPLATTLWGC